MIRLKFINAQVTTSLNTCASGVKLNRNHIITGILGAIVFGFVLYAIIQDNITKKKWADPNLLKAKTTANIYGFNGGAKTCPAFDYEFYVQNKKYKGSYCIVTMLRQRRGNELKKFIGKEFTVIYIVDNPNYNRLLLPKKIEDGYIPEDW